MLLKFVMSPRGLALDRFLVRYLGFSLTIPVFARANGKKPHKALYLETTGSKSGKTRGVALPFFVIDGKRLIVGSKGGAPEDPAWAKNLRANPEAVVYIKRRKHQVLARFLQGSEREEYFNQLKSRTAGYPRYEKLTTREIPVIELRER